MLLPDVNVMMYAFLAAMAIENRCEWVTTDTDYARFPGLCLGHPLEC
jgi:predicted nucleic acid-binding protein